MEKSIKNNLLAFCIPTYNRSEILEEVLEDLISKIKDYSFFILISDNFSTDDTKVIVNKYMLKYEYIIYNQQKENLGADKNIQSTLKLFKANYYWLIGDSACLKNKSLLPILNFLTVENPDAYIINVSSRVKNLPSQLFVEREDLLLKLGWHMTQLPALIVSERIVNNNYFKRYENKSFFQFGIIFEYLGLQEFIKVYWDDNDYINKPKTKKINTWYPNKAWEYFMKNWADTVFSLPSSYSLETKIQCIKNHDKMTGIFSVKSLFYQKSAKAYSFKVFTKYKKYIKFSNSNLLICFLISIFPISVFLKKNIHSKQ
ncbi:glycosyltransferase involved in cell wall biosynthesis [Arcicella aurantiaca]|uniref:Glycosyltransferase involved in cell wall biosynthesis n=1 Tax=Arcicella aurantiaca TaxID=591202 RepID=A0A316DTJ2_9BACT|nr:glycosyltransferase family 2 protein [Arcicella aurantiaca]PWK21411.1 glycosyltransferase involved in cell wall biosynthesis [Arcicella aurantiaca]